MISKDATNDVVCVCVFVPVCLCVCVYSTVQYLCACLCVCACLSLGNLLELDDIGISIGVSIFLLGEVAGGGDTTEFLRLEESCAEWLGSD